MSGRLWMLAPLTVAGMLSAASGEIVSPCSASVALSSFDYLVLASIADSQHPISMAGYCRPRPDDSPTP